MSEAAQEGQLVESLMSAEEMAALSPPRETEGEVPESTKTFGTVKFEDVEACCKAADEQADDRESLGSDSASDSN